MREWNGMERHSMSMIEQFLLPPLPSPSLPSRPVLYVYMIAECIVLYLICAVSFELVWMKHNHFCIIAGNDTLMLSSTLTFTMQFNVLCLYKYSMYYISYVHVHSAASKLGHKHWEASFHMNSDLSLLSACSCDSTMQMLEYSHVPVLWQLKRFRW